MKQKISSEAVDLLIRPLPSPLLSGVPRGLLHPAKCRACDLWLHSEDQNKLGKGVNCFVDAVPLTHYKQYLQIKIKSLNLKVFLNTSGYPFSTITASHRLITEQQPPLQTHTAFRKASRDLWSEQPLRRLLLQHKKPKDKCYAPTTGSHAKGAGLFKEVWTQNSIWNNNSHMLVG